MAEYFEIPTQPAPQRMTIQLSGVIYVIVMTWNEPLGHWVMDFLDERDVLLLAGVPVVSGCDLLGQYRHLGFGGSLIAQTDGNADAPPTFENLGVTGRLYYVTGDA